MRPLPENFMLSRASTFDVVQRIRCEAKAGLERYGSDGEARKIIGATTIGYDFDFNMTEDNNAGTESKPGLLTFTNKNKGKGLDLDLTASAERKRENVRRFLIVEDLAKLAEAECSGPPARANWVYPIGGTIGMDEVVATYIRLEKLSDLVNPDDPHPSTSLLGSTKSVLFGDVLTFRTTLQAGAEPTLSLSPVSGRFRLTNASIVATAKRQDVHTVIVALARAKDQGDIDPVVAGKGQRGGPSKHKVADRRARPVQYVNPGRKVTQAQDNRENLIYDREIVDRRTETALAQKNADATNQVVMELARLRSLREDARETPRFLGEKLLEFMRPPEFVRPKPPEDTDSDG